jgi:hypothetical protein
MANTLFTHITSHRLNVREIERKCEIPAGMLAKAIKGRQPLPVKYWPLLTNYLKTLGYEGA